MKHTVIRNVIGTAVAAVLLAMPVFAEDDDWDTSWDSGFESSWGDDGDLFGSDDNLFGGDDDMFADDGIVDFTQNTISGSQAATIFQAGSVKIGGNWSSSVSTSTSFPKDSKFWTDVKDSTLTVNLGAQLSVDARPTDSLRMYGKGGINYPFATSGDTSHTANSADLQDLIDSDTKLVTQLAQMAGITQPKSYSTSTYNSFYIKELFTDFDISDNLTARFGKQTITWGVGYFFSPASNIVNLSAIDPENPTVQVDGPIALRNQIVFPGTQNTLYLYAIPSTSYEMTYQNLMKQKYDYTVTNTKTSFVRDTALAAKTELVFGTFELGLGGWYQNQRAPVAMSTITGPFTKKGTFYGEATLRFGDESAWKKENASGSKSKALFKGTVGGMLNWSDPGIALLGSYYYDGEELTDTTKKLAEFQGVDWKALTTYGHNLVISASFSKLGLSDLSLSTFALYNITNESLKATVNLQYAGISHVSLGMGPTMQWTGYKNAPTFSYSLTASLGGGKF